MHEILTCRRLYCESSSTFNFNLLLIYLLERKKNFHSSLRLTSISILFYFHARFYKCEVNRKVISKETSEESNVECLLNNFFSSLGAGGDKQWLTLLCNAVKFHFLPSPTSSNVITIPKSIPPYFSLLLKRKMSMRMRIDGDRMQNYFILVYSISLLFSICIKIEFSSRVEYWKSFCV